jgi:hypothetical protein
MGQFVPQWNARWVKALGIVLNDQQVEMVSVVS